VAGLVRFVPRSAAEARGGRGGAGRARQEAGKRSIPRRVRSILRRARSIPRRARSIPRRSRDVRRCAPTRPRNTRRACSERARRRMHDAAAAARGPRARAPTARAGAAGEAGARVGAADAQGARGQEQGPRRAVLARPLAPPRSHRLARCEKRPPRLGAPRSPRACVTYLQRPYNVWITACNGPRTPQLLQAPGQGQLGAPQGARPRPPSAPPPYSRYLRGRRVLWPRRRRG